MTDPVISVVIPTYNRAHYLCRAVESVLAQEGVEVEVVIVDDGSTDGTAAVVERHHASWGARVAYHRQANAERGAARNAGLRLTRGGYVAFLDSDDVWQLHHGRACLEALARAPQAVAAFGECGQMDASGRVIRAQVRRPIERASLVRDLCLKRLILHPTEVVLRRAMLGEDPFDPSIPGAEDWLLWVQLAARAPFEPVGAPTVWMRVHPHGTFGDPDKFTRSLMQAAERVIATGVPQDAGVAAARILSINRAHCAYAYYLAGRWDEAWRRWRAAIQGLPGIAGEPDFWPITTKLLLGPRLTRRIRNARQQGRGPVIGAGEPVLER